MKAFVIKNGEEKYWSGYEWVEDLIFADMYTNKHDINSDATWQEIIIEETNLQNQKAIECLKEIYDLYEPYENDKGDVILTHNGVSFIEYIDTKIKELEASSECDF